MALRYQTAVGPLQALQQEQRGANQAFFFLREVSALEMVDGDMTPAGLLAEEVHPVGQMREVCPYCGVPLQLVLRHSHVRRTHLFCNQCSRCFDACYADGSSALSRPTLPIF